MPSVPTPSELDRTTSAFSDLASTPKMKLNHRYQVSFNSMHSRLLRELITLRREFPAPPQPVAPAPDPEPQALPAPANEIIPELRNEPTKSPAITKTSPAKPIHEPTRPCLTPTEPASTPDDPYPTCAPFDPEDLK